MLIDISCDDLEITVRWYLIRCLIVYFIDSAVFECFCIFVICDFQLPEPLSYNGRIASFLTFTPKGNLQEVTQDHDSLHASSRSICGDCFP